jgi:signal transduction histidine kinase
VAIAVDGAGWDGTGPPTDVGAGLPRAAPEDPVRAAVAVTTSVVGVVRLFAAGLALPAVFAAASPGRAATALGLSLLMAAALARRADRLTGTAGRAALLLVADLGVGAAGFAVAGFGIPCLYQTLGTAALAAALYGVPGVAVGAAAGMAASVLAVWTMPFGIAEPLPLGVVIAIPSAYTLVALVGALVRHLHQEQVQLRQSLRDATSAAARAHERARLGRELHDSLAKTLVGIGLSARAVRGAKDRPARVDELAGEIATAADEATVQARAVIAGLRGTAPPDLAAAVRAAVAGWARTAAVAVRTDLAAGPEPDPDTGRELLAVLGEALANVGRHAGASRVWVELAAADGRLRLTVRDDGRGFAVPADPARLARAGRYGVVGMIERLHGVGGVLSLRSTPGLGTTLVAEVPVR